MISDRFAGWIAGLAVGVMLLLAGCSKGPTTATGLAGLLSKEIPGGVVTGLSNPPQIPRIRIDDSALLQTTGLKVEILKAGDTRSFKFLQGAGTIVGIANVKAKGKLPDAPSVIAKWPWVLIVREEPRPGSVREAFSRVPLD